MDNVALLQSIKVEADTLKVRSLQEIIDHEPKSPKPDDEDDTPHGKKQKTYSIKTINTIASWQLETVGDVNQRLQELRSKLEEKKVMQIEF